MEDVALTVNKSSRHSKITGDFAERLILYWLSKYGFECVHVDHVAIDIIAQPPRSHERMGISVKSRSRNSGKEGTSIKIPVEHLNDLKAQCPAFACTPYVALVADEADTITGFILSAQHLIDIHRPQANAISWKMTSPWIARCEADPDIKIFRFTTQTGNWWPRHPISTGDSVKVA